jgi:protein-tyrosine kinase
MSKVFEALRRLEAQSDGLLVNINAEAKAILQQSAPTFYVEPVEPTKAEQATAILTAIPEVQTQAPPPPAPARVMSLRVSVKSPLVPFIPIRKSHARAAEEYRTIRTKIIQNPLAPRMIAVSSVGPQDGKTVTSLNLAATFALKENTRVLLVDGDMRRGSVGSLLGMPDTLGLADILSGTTTLDAAVIRTQQLPGLHILPSGNRMKNPAELLDSPRWPELAMQLRNRFDYVILDTPPIGIITDFDLLQAQSDGIVLIARQDHTSRARFLAAVAAIQPARLLGVVLNCSQDWFLARDRSGYVYETLPH